MNRNNEQSPRRVRKAIAAVLATAAVTAGGIEGLGEGHMDAKGRQAVTAPTQWDALDSTKGALNEKDRVGYLMRQELGRESIDEAAQSGLHIVPESVEIIDSPINPLDDLKPDSWNQSDSSSTPNQ